MSWKGWLSYVYSLSMVRLPLPLRFRAWKPASYSVQVNKMAEGSRNTRLPSGYDEDFVNAVEYVSWRWRSLYWRDAATDFAKNANPDFF